ncbi:MAG: 2-hydroxyacyl-CoA dehydratase family protein [Fusobacteria bacterium]|nr:2-hydroxyacyl-CoA dehydratase family protein [Fusobacteriota bacterium]
MSIAKKLGHYLKQNIDSPAKVQKTLKRAFRLQYYIFKFSKKKHIPKSLRYLNVIGMKYMLEPLKNPEKSVFVNIFTPTEILHAFGLKSLQIEGMSAFLSAAWCEDSFVDIAESKGLSDTLCSYHKTFLGASFAKVIQKPLCGVTTTTACDANVNTFRTLSEMYGVEQYIIDVPFESSDANIHYVANQLEELVAFLERVSGIKFRLERLKEVIEIENETVKFYKKYLKALETKYFPNSLSAEMSKVLALQIGLGRKESLKFFKLLAKDIENYPIQEAKFRLFWVHILPIYSKSLGELFNFSNRHHLLLSDMNIDYLEPLDSSKPFEALAKKLINSHYNGHYSRRAENIIGYVKRMKADGVINFAHWGCKETAGASLLLKEYLSREDIPLLTIEGDGVDKRNSQEEQNRTRLEAFFEMLEARSK